MKEPETIDDWLRLVKQHHRAAERLVSDKVVANQGHFHTGLAVECALKAYIMRKERFNSWPSREARPDLYVHDLRRLVRVAGIELDARTPQAPSWHVVLQWDRNQGYDPMPMPRRVAASMFEAAFSKEGVVTWLRSKLI